MFKKMRGFTLVELIIVIVIIGILAAVTVVGYQNQTAKARDSKRLSDIDSIRKAVDLYYHTNGKYPDYVPGNTCAGEGGFCYTSSGNLGNYIGGLTEYFPDGLPNDPTNKTVGGRPFFYIYQTYSVPAPCNVDYSKRIFLGVRNFETLTNNTFHPSSPLNESLTVCTTGMDSMWWTGAREWVYTSLQGK
jgi:prepilin-type N-terminal cleavage/methylation domain-containing protein